MAVNNPTSSSALRAPRGVVTLNGTALDRFTDFSVINNSHYQSDTFRLSLPLYGQPSTSDWAYWSTETDIEVSLSVAFLDQSSGALLSPTNLLIGLADEVNVDSIRGTVTVTGRDYSSKFIDTKTTDKYPQLTASQIATKLATEQGLTPNVTDTSTPVGVYYDDEGSRLTREETEWDFLTALGQREGFQVLVQGNTLYFGPAPDLSSTPPYLIQWVPAPAGGLPSCNATSLQFSRALTIARDIVVTVLSHSRETGKSVKAEARSTNALRSGRSGRKAGAQTYVFNLPNLTQGQAQAEANKRLLDLSRHERIVEGTLPGDSLLTMQSVMQVIGTGTDWDQTYFLDRIEREIGFGSGYGMRFRVKNHSTYSEVTP